MRISRTLHGMLLIFTVTMLVLTAYIAGFARGVRHEQHTQARLKAQTALVVERYMDTHFEALADEVAEVVRKLQQERE